MEWLVRPKKAKLVKPKKPKGNEEADNESAKNEVYGYENVCALSCPSHGCPNLAVPH